MREREGGRERKCYIPSKGVRCMNVRKSPSIGSSLPRNSSRAELRTSILG